MNTQPIASTKNSKLDIMSAGDTVKVPRIGDVVTGTVVSVSKHEVHLDIEGFGLGVVRGHELLDESGLHGALKIGENAEATVLDLENEKGELELSFRLAGHKKAWQDLDAMRRSGDVIEVTVTDANRGGLIVRVGKVEGFLPVSQMLPERYPRVEGGDKNKILEKLRSFIGSNVPVRVIDSYERDGRLIVSEKAAREEKQKEKLAQYQVDSTIEGTVAGLVDFGAFVRFGDDLEGLIHISEIDWKRIGHPKDVLTVGEKVQAKVIGISGGRVSLSRKALLPNPWEQYRADFKVGDLVEGKVSSVNRFGAFVEVRPGLLGLVHISELGDAIDPEHPFDKFPAGSSHTWRILAFEPERQRLALSGKEPKANEPKKEDEVVSPTLDEVLKDATAPPEPAQNK